MNLIKMRNNSPNENKRPARYESKIVQNIKPNNNFTLEMGRSSILYFVVTTLYVVTITRGLDNKNVVVSNGVECAEIGMSMFKKGGGAIDAMIATLFCEGVTGAQSNGLGGGFVATVYANEKKGGKRRVRTLIAREQAPGASNSTMFVGRNVTGILAVAIPGELKGYQALHNEYGLLEWADLVQPTIDLCKNGYRVNQFLYDALNQEKSIIQNEPSLREIFCDSNGNIKKIGDIITRPKLMKTLETISSEGPDTMYTKGGKIAEALAAEIAALKGIITINDLVNYTVQWKVPINTTLQKDNKNYKLYSVPLPASGAILALILNMVNGYKKTPSVSVEYYHHIAESYKFAYGARSQLGSDDSLDVKFSGKEYADGLVKEIDYSKTYNDTKHYHAAYADQLKDHGTANIVVLAANGDAIAVTTTVNTLFGAKIHSESTGIILNDEMDDFSVPGTTNAYGVPASEANFIEPWKRPVSSMCPTIVLNENGDVVYISGAAGGTTITTTVAYVFVKQFWLGNNLHDAVAASRYHHQLLPMELQTEDSFNETLKDGLRAKGHNCTKLTLLRGFSAATTISRLDGTVQAEFDPRRNGSKEISAARKLNFN